MNFPPSRTRPAFLLVGFSAWFSPCLLAWCFWRWRDGRSLGRRKRARPRGNAGTQAGGKAGGQNGAAGRGGDSGEIEVLHVQGNVSMLAGAGGNITVQTGNDGILLVDTGSAAMSDKVVEALRRLSKGQVTYIINTDDRSDHIGGNEVFAETGHALAIGRAAQASVMIVAFDSILERMSAPTGKTTAVPEKAWPNDPYSSPAKSLFFNGEGVEIYHQPGTTDGNSIVVFRHSDVISTGDIFDITEYPIIDLKSGGSLKGDRGAESPEADGCSGDHQEGGTMIIPGHGRLCDEADLALSADGHHCSRPAARHDKERHDVRTDKGGPTNRGLRSHLRQQQGQLDDRYVYGGGIQEPHRQAGD